MSNKLLASSITIISILFSLPTMTASFVLADFNQYIIANGSYFSSASSWFLSITSIVMIPILLLSKSLCRIFGKKNLLVFSLLSYIAVSILFIAAEQAWQFIALRVLVGISAGLIISIAPTLCTDFYSNRSSSMVMRKLVEVSYLGAMAILILILLLSQIYWKYVLASYAVALIPLIFVVLHIPEHKFIDTNTSDEIMYLSKSRGLLSSIKLSPRAYAYLILMLGVTAFTFVFPANVASYVFEYYNGSYVVNFICQLFYLLGSYVSSVIIYKYSVRYFKQYQEYVYFIILLMGFIMFIAGAKLSIYILIASFTFIGLGYGSFAVALIQKSYRSLDSGKLDVVPSLIYTGMYVGQFICPFMLSAHASSTSDAKAGLESVYILGALGIVLMYALYSAILLIIQRKERKDALA